MKLWFPCSFWVVLFSSLSPYGRCCQEWYCCPSFLGVVLLSPLRWCCSFFVHVKWGEVKWWSPRLLLSGAASPPLPFFCVLLWVLLSILLWCGWKLIIYISIFYVNHFRFSFWKQQKTWAISSLVGPHREPTSYSRELPFFFFTLFVTGKNVGGAVFSASFWWWCCFPPLLIWKWCCFSFPSLLAVLSPFSRLMWCCFCSWAVLHSPSSLYRNLKWCDEVQVR